MTPEQITAARERLGMTQAAFAEAIGYSGVQAVRNLESGFRKPSRSVVLLIEALLKEKQG